MKAVKMQDKLRKEIKEMNQQLQEVYHVTKVLESENELSQKLKQLDQYVYINKGKQYYASSYSKNIKPAINLENLAHQHESRINDEMRKVQNQINWELKYKQKSNRVVRFQHQ